MSLQVLESKARNLRTFLGLTAVWSVLQSALVLSIYKLGLSDTAAYFLAIVPLTPCCIIVALALRRRRAEANIYLRQYYFGAVLYAVVLSILTLLPIWFELSFDTPAVIAVGLAVFPFVLGLVPALLLLLPKKLMGGEGLGTMPPVRIKLVGPALRRIFRVTILYIVYIFLNLGSSLFFSEHAANGLVSYIVALLPVLPVFGLIPIYNKYMAEEQDEFQRHLFHQSILWALIGTLVLASIMGRLQEHGLIFARHPGYFHPYSVFPLFWWLQLEAVFAVNAVQGFREKRSQ